MGWMEMATKVVPELNPKEEGWEVEGRGASPGRWISTLGWGALPTGFPQLGSMSHRLLGKEWGSHHV